MNLGYGLTALDSYFKEGDARQVRERADQRFDWERQKAQSELSLLGDKTAADRSGYQNTVGANAAAAELRPQETANKKAQLGNDATKIAGETKRLPGLEQAKDSEAVAAAGAAKVKEALQGVEVERIPSMVADAKMKGAINDATSMNLVGSTIADLIDSGNQAGLVKLLNAQKQYAGDPKIAALPDVASVAKARDANGQEMLVLKDDAGNVIMSRPVSIYQAARDSLKKQEVKEVKAGESLVSVRGNTVTPLYTAPPDPNSRMKDNRPSEIRLADYYISKGVPEDEALRRAGRLKDMSPANAEFQLYKDRVSLNPNADEATKQKIRQEVRKEVQDIFGGSGAALSNAPGAAGGGPVDPKVSAAIKYPSGQPAASSPGLSQAPTVAQAPTTAPAPAPQAQAAQPATLQLRLARATQADSQEGGGRNFSALVEEVSANAPRMQQQIQALKAALPNSSGSQRQAIQNKIAEIERDMPLIQSILNQAGARRGY